MGMLALPVYWIHLLIELHRREQTFKLGQVVFNLIASNSRLLQFFLCDLNPLLQMSDPLISVPHRY
jgi:hypothetical protein